MNCYYFAEDQKQATETSRRALSIYKKELFSLPDFAPHCCHTETRDDFLLATLALQIAVQNDGRAVDKVDRCGDHPTALLSLRSNR